jgi:hypothetical protein
LADDPLRACRGIYSGDAALITCAEQHQPHPLDNGLEYCSGFDDNVDISPRRLTETEAYVRTSPDIEADVNARTIDDAAAPHTRADAEADIVYPPKCHFNSFSEDTTVVTTEGDIPISELEVGDTVVAYDETTGETGEYEITDTISHEDPIIVHLTINGELIETTPEHPFYTSEGEWINAGELEVGELIYSLDGEFGAVESVVFVADPQQMYNLTVDEAHTFFVGDGEWLVHNCGGGRQLPLPGMGQPPDFELGELEVGIYSRLQAKNKARNYTDLVTPHHMPSSAYMKSLNIDYKESQGVTFNISSIRHSWTRTFSGRKPIRGSNPRLELARDIWDVRNIYRSEGLYNNEVREALRKVISLNKKIYEDLYIFVK